MTVGQFTKFTKMEQLQLFMYYKRGRHHGMPSSNGPRSRGESASSAQYDIHSGSLLHSIAVVLPSLTFWYRSPRVRSDAEGALPPGRGAHAAVQVAPHRVRAGVYCGRALGRRCGKGEEVYGSMGYEDR
jgi:hypothetical protein